MKNFHKINLLIFSTVVVGFFIYLKQNPGFKGFELLRLDTSDLMIGIDQGHAYIKKSGEMPIYLPILKGEKDLEIIWSKNHQDLYLLRRNIQGIDQIYLVDPITKKAIQKSFTLRPKSHLQVVSKQRVSFKSGNEVLVFSFRTNKTKGLLPPLFINQTPESRAKIFAFYQQLEGQLVSYKIEPKLKEIHFNWKDPSNQTHLYTQPLIVSKNTLSLPKK